MMLRESAIERRATAYAVANGWIALKLNGYGNIGKPDRMYLKNGHAVFIEYKREGKRPTKLQSYFLARLTDAGFVAEYADSVKSAIEILQRSGANA